MINRYSLHKIYEEGSVPFNIFEYSLFKFGDIAYAEKFAKELFDGFIKKHKEWILKNNEIIILPSPYLSIPTASNYLCRYFKRNLNRFLFENEKNVCIESKIYRKQTYVEDYGNMNYEQRVRLISNDTYYIDRNFIDGKACIFIDDIKITGSHEHVVHKILNDAHVGGAFLFIYYGELCSNEVNPNIENYFNYSAVKNIDDIVNICFKPTFRFNTRIIKYILQLPQSDFLYVYDKFSTNQKNIFFELLISNNYHQIYEFQSNLKLIK